MQSQYLDAMTLVERYDKPNLFVTITCNPKWVEIKEAMQLHDGMRKLSIDLIC